MRRARPVQAIAGTLLGLLAAGFPAAAAGPPPAPVAGRLRLVVEPAAARPGPGRDPAARRSPAAGRRPAAPGRRWPLPIAQFLAADLRLRRTHDSKDSEKEIVVRELHTRTRELRTKTEELQRIDIERLKGEEERRRAEMILSMLAKAVETMSLGVTITDMKNQILYVNPADARQHGYSVDELIGQDSRIYAAEEGGIPLDPTEVEPWSRERFNVTKTGDRMPVRLVSDRVRNSEGEPIATVTICEDIRERLRTREALERRDHILEAVAFAAEKFLAQSSWAESVEEVLGAARPGHRRRPRVARDPRRQRPLRPRRHGLRLAAAGPQRPRPRRARAARPLGAHAAGRRDGRGQALPAAARRAGGARRARRRVAGGGAAVRARRLARLPGPRGARPRPPVVGGRTRGAQDRGPHPGRLGAAPRGRGGARPQRSQIPRAARVGQRPGAERRPRRPLPVRQPGLEIAPSATATTRCAS